MPSVFRINTQNLRKSHEAFWFVVDFLMLGLLVINLTWLVLDSLFAVAVVRDLLMQWLPEISKAYEPIHRHFIFIDFVFVMIFLGEFGIRWIDAIYRHIYARWYFYPFIHWYDLVGCIPAGGYRFLRVLRLFSILYRLQKYEIIDFSHTRVYQFIKFYYDALLEELSDRIVVKVLSGTQEEIRRGSPLLHQIQQQILLPRKQQLVDWISDKTIQVLEQAFAPNRSALRGYIADKVDFALRNNAEVQRLRILPIFGSSLEDSLEKAVSDIVGTVIDGILVDLGSRENHRFIEDISDVFLQGQTHERGELDREVLDALVQLLELVKSQVHIKRWQDSLQTKDNLDDGISEQPES